MSTDGLMEDAARILSGEVALGARGPRVAAALTRSAFEHWVDWMCEPWLATGDGRPSGRSKLIVLSALHDPPLGERAGRAWDGLSRASHHHAYELQPSSADVRALHAGVSALMATPIARATGTSKPWAVRAYLEGGS